MTHPRTAVPLAAALTVGALAFTGGASPAEAAPVACHGERATVVGSAGRDVLEGTPGRDVIAGGGGNDTLRGLGGRDLLCGGAGADLLDGGPGDDDLLGGLDLMEGGETPYHRGDQLRGGPGDDLLDAGYDARGPRGGGDVVLWTDAPNGVRVDLAAGTARGHGHDQVRLTDGTVHLTRFDDVLVGSAGPETVQAFDGDDDLRLGGGDDTAYPDDIEEIADDTVVAGAGDDVVRSFGGTDEIEGGDGRDYLLLVGNRLKTAYAGAGRDVVEVVVTTQAGHRLAGGPGHDRVLVELGDSTGAGSTLDLGAGLLTLEGQTSTARAFEDAEVYFGPFTVVGTEGPNRVTTRDDVSAVTFLGLGGDDAFGGGALDDTFDGGDGTDTYLGDEGGLNSCTSVEVDPNLSCAAG